MKTGLFYVNECHDGNYERAYGEMLEQIQYGEELGFESVWLAEHHFSSYGSLASPQVAAAAISQITKKMDIGIGVSILNFDNPVRIAEDYAMVDILSEGRLKFGAGRGYQPLEAKGLGVPMEKTRERFWEYVEIIQGLWNNETFSYDGEFYQLDNVSLVPKPVQERIPFYYAAISPASFDLMVEKEAREFMVTPTLMVLDDVLDYTKRTRDRLIQKGITPDIHMNLQMNIADDTDQAVKNVEENMKVYFNRVLDLIPGAKGMQAPKTYERFAEVAKEFDGPLDVRGLNDTGVALLTDAQDAINRLEIVEQAGVNSLSCWFRMGGMEHRKVMKAMKRYADEVLPYFKAINEKIGK
ncbi:LLM class flavin-dependent oxidoreductase [Desertibacillus haloalkaliphilus]|uniref:LLM class flavin-dependent oxidoreductase n=1 Tax=Desertibacillus haloalkaliphilus TaxID=1328930 RepID=UPI001C266BBB|nr:LLM class flavin-dependent oxidoreductase [Desertibacillus haloalkaliphilus]MBU8906250.1 LLM class flavin-dependent oxidoreductase [Desertibacillus haloalkaliphilus]